MTGNVTWRLVRLDGTDSVEITENVQNEEDGRNVVSEDSDAGETALEPCPNPSLLNDSYTNPQRFLSFDVRILGSTTRTYNAVLAIGTMTQSVSVSGNSLTGPKRITFAFDASSFATGYYGYSLNLTPTNGGSSVPTKTGTKAVVNNSQSDFGNRWSLTGISRLHSTNAGIGRFEAGGKSQLFTQTANGYQVPTGFFGTFTATRNSQGNLTGYALAYTGGPTENYNTNGLLTSVVELTGRKTLYEYIDGDGDGQADEISTIKDATESNSAAWDLLSQFTYYAATGPDGALQGKLATRTVITCSCGTGGQNYVYRYNSNGTLASVTGPPTATGLSSVTRFGYDSATKLLTSKTDPTNVATYYTYDEYRGLASVTKGGDSNFYEVSTVYYVSAAKRSMQSNGVTDPGSVYATVTVNGMETKRYFDARGLVVKEIDPRRTVQYTYNSSELLTSIVVTPSNGTAAQATYYEYNNAGRVTKETLTDGSSTQYVYESDGWRLQSATQYAPPSNPWPRQILSSTAYYSFQTTGQVYIAVSTAAGVAQTESYTYYTEGVAKGLLASRTVSNTAGVQSVEVFTYNDDRPRLKSVLKTDPNPNNPNGNNVLQTTIAYQSTSTGETRTITETDSTAGATSTASRVTIQKFDLRGRLIEEIQPGFQSGSTTINPAWKYEYDAAGRLVKQTDPRNQVWLWNYNSNGNLYQSVAPDPDAAGTGLTPLVTRYEYYNNLISSGSGFGENLFVSIEQSGRATSYLYDAFGRLYKTEVSDPDGEGGPLQAMSTFYTYDALDRVTLAEHRSGKMFSGIGVVTLSTEEFIYDSMNRLLRARDAEGRVSAFVYGFEGPFATVSSYAPQTMSPNGATWKTEALSAATTATISTGVFDGFGRLRASRHYDPVASSPRDPHHR